MIEKEVVVKNYPGIHAHPAGLLVKLASRFSAEVFVTKEDMTVNGKSIMGVLTLAAETGAKLTIRAEGEDASEAVDAIVGLIESKFEEEQG